MNATVATLCPGAPLFVESISNSPRPLPFLTTDFWKGYPNLHPADIVDFSNSVVAVGPSRLSSRLPTRMPRRLRKGINNLSFNKALLTFAATVGQA